MSRPCYLLIILVTGLSLTARADESRLLRQPTLSDDHIAFAHGSDLWIVDRDGGDARRLTSTPAVESDPHFSPDGKWIAFTSNRSGSRAVYVIPIEGGSPRRLTWYPDGAEARGWSADGKDVLYASSRETAPVGYNRLWTVSRDGGPSRRLPAPWGHDGSYSGSGKRLVVESVARWDSEWRHYRGGQNTPLTILNLDNLEERHLPNERTTDTQPLWLGQRIYFLSDRDWTMNLWAYDPATEKLSQLTHYDDADVKSLSGHDDTLVFERNGYLHLFGLESGEAQRVKIRVLGDFPWMETRWEDVSQDVRSASPSATGKRALFEARGDIFTVPATKGNARNITRSSGAADRAPTWSPQGNEIAWFSDEGDGYALKIADQDGLSKPRRIAIGESKMGWETTWSPDGTRIAFVDDDVRIRVVTVESGDILTADTGGVNIERGGMGLRWSPDSKWLVYAKTFPNQLRRIVVWSVDEQQAHPLTDFMADAAAPSWGRDGKRLYFLASTNVALGSGWANTSQMAVRPEYGVYAILLAEDASTPFAPESDEESKPSDEDAKADDEGEDEGDDSEDTAKTSDTEATDADVKKTSNDQPTAPHEQVADKQEDKKNEGKSDDAKENEDEEGVEVKIDFDELDRRTISLPMPVARYTFTLGGPADTLFVGERPSSGPGTVHKFSFKDRKTTTFLKGARSVSISADGKKLLYRMGDAWHLADTKAPPSSGKGKLNVSLQVRLDRGQEWQQIFDEAWRYMRDYFYDPKLHGRDWDIVRERYAPLVPHVKHRADLNYVLDQMSGEMSVGHSFVGGGDVPDIDNNSRVGVLGANLIIDQGRWKIDRIFTFESWNPQLKAPLDQPGLRVKAGHYLLAVNGTELTSEDDPYRLLDGTAGRQTQLRLNGNPDMEGSWTAIVEPQRNERALRQRAWVEDNRRKVDELSAGKLAYVWVPNTGQPGVVSFNRYFFAQQDKLGAVIDERFNGGGLLDDYMVDLMTRRLRAAISNEVPNGRPFRLPAGILGPKVLLINELAGSGGDFFPWVFRQQKAGPLIGTRTWGGLVKSSVHYPLIDGGMLTAPDNAVFDPHQKRWIAENEGVAPDIEVRRDAKSHAAGVDPQLERGVIEALKLLDAQPVVDVRIPAYPTPAKRPE